MSSNNRNQRGRNAGGQGQGQGQQQRRRGRNPQQGGSGGQQARPQAPKGPMMTALGESTYEAVFDHGSEGYGIWFDGMVKDDPMYKQFWKGLGLRSIYVKLEEDRIVIVRDLDREIPIVASDAHSESGSKDVDFAEEVAKVDDVTYTPEEAARLFASEAAGVPAAPAETQATPDGEASSDAAHTTDDDDAEAPGDEPAASAASDDGDEDAPKKPAVRRRVTTRRTPVKRATKSDDGDSAPADEE